MYYVVAPACAVSCACVRLLSVHSCAFIVLHSHRAKTDGDLACVQYIREKKSHSHDRANSAMYYSLTLTHTGSTSCDLRAACGPLLSLGLSWLSCGSDTHHTQSQFSTANESFIHKRKFHSQRHRPCRRPFDHSPRRLGTRSRLELAPVAWTARAGKGTRNIAIIIWKLVLRHFYARFIQGPKQKQRSSQAPTWPQPPNQHSPNMGQSTTPVR